MDVAGGSGFATRRQTKRKTNGQILRFSLLPSSGWGSGVGGTSAQVLTLIVKAANADSAFVFIRRSMYYFSGLFVCILLYCQL